MSSSLSAAPLPDPNESYVKQLYILCTLFPILATVAVALRFLSRRLKRIEFWWDDWTSLLCLVWIWIDFAAVMRSIAHGKGKHLAFLNPHDKTMINYWSFWFSIFYTAIPPTIKVSALLMYRRIFRADGFNKLVTAMLVIVTCWGISSILISIFGCWPVAAFWTHKGKCLDEHAWVLADGIPNIVFDVIVWAMPIPRIWILNLSRDQKVTLTIIFLIGLTDCALALIRLSGSANMLGQPDTSYSWAPAMWWSVIHTCLGVVVICLPTMRVLVTTASSHLTSLRTTRNTSNNSTALTSKRSRSNYVNVQDGGISLTGDNENSMHSNTITLALRKGSLPTSIPESGINVKYEFTLENTSKENSSVSQKESI